MKRRISFITILTMLGILLIGCSSSDKIKDLEKRVEHLENILLENYSQMDVNMSLTDSSDYQTQVETYDENEQVHNESIVFDNASTDGFEYSFSLDGFSNERIIQLCDQVFSIVPYDGQSYEEYRQSLLVQPVSFDEPPSLKFYYVSPYQHENMNCEKNAVLSVEVIGTYMEMNGTIGCGGNTGNYKTMTIELIINEFEKASEIYGGLSELLSPPFRNHGREVKEERGSDIWQSYGWLPMSNSNDSSTLASIFLTMKKINNCFIITASKVYDPRVVQE